MDWVGAACRDNPPRAGVDAVRMPGDRGMARKAAQEAAGVLLHPTIAPVLSTCALAYGLDFPKPLPAG